MNTLTIAEFWRLRGLIDGHGLDGAAKLLRVSTSTLESAIHPGCDDATLGKIRERLARQKVVPLVPLKRRA